MSQQPKHTPGPWYKGRTTIDGDTWVVLARYNEDYSTPIATDCTEANARLIAAAPELGEALLDLLGDLPDIQESGGRFSCVRCGREYSGIAGDTEIPINCPSDLCPSFLARAALRKAGLLEESS
jgi:hypothetical protein